MTTKILSAAVQTQCFKLVDFESFKAKALFWANQFDTVCFLDSNQYERYPYHAYECLLGVEADDEIEVDLNGFDQLKTFQKTHQDWLFGYLSYDLKNEIEQLTSKHFDGINLPNLHFFKPKYFFKFTKEQVEIRANNPLEVFKSIQKILLSEEGTATKLTLTPRISKATYLETVEKIRQHIIEGDIYEMNFCQEFFTTSANINPVTVFLELNRVSKAPFAAFYKLNNRYLLCGSPERFLKKEGSHLISQPIKGTIKRSQEAKEDEALRNALFRDEKNRAENVMIVDLVRNDLARSCKAGSVKVEELFGIYTFEQVHQMISTVIGALKPDFSPIDALKNAFPMGSMTGAPKVMSMELIEQYEKTKRGLYSGAVGYFTPNGDFDFNVVIRSVLFNALTNYLSVQVGGAIVYDSIPEEEYEECLVKASAIIRLLGELREGVQSE